MKNTVATAEASAPELPAVAQAMALLQEARDWWAWFWAARENQTRVRSAIEEATAAIEREIEKARKAWSADLLDAYAGRKAGRKGNRMSRALTAAESEFQRATALAKKTLDEAEREWNAAKAREGAALAQIAIRKHEALLRMARSAHAA